jgi:hypothetical protein
MSAGAVAEALIVAERRNVGTAVLLLVNELGFEAALNFGDCFAYDRFVDTSQTI